MTARDDVLARIRTATAGGSASPPVARNYRTAEQPAALAGEELLERLVERLVDYRALVRRSTTALVAATVVAALTERGARRIAVPDGILPAGLDRLEPGIELVGDDPPLTPAQLDGLDGVLTGCAVAIAETGTIVLDGGPGQGRRVLSLVPDYHLVVVTAAQVVGGVPEAMARLDPDERRRVAKGLLKPTGPLFWSLVAYRLFHGKKMELYEVVPATSRG